MFLIGENLNVINTIIGRAFKEKDPGPIAEEAIRQKEKAMDWIDINLGPARKGGPELMEFVVKTVQDAIGDEIPLCLDTSNIEAMEAGLVVCKGKAIINSIMCRPERLRENDSACSEIQSQHDRPHVGAGWSSPGRKRAHGPVGGTAVRGQ